MISRLLPDPELELCALLFIEPPMVVAGDWGAVVVGYGVEEVVVHSRIQPGPHMGLQYGIVVRVDWTAVVVRCAGYEVEKGVVSVIYGVEVVEEVQPG